MTAPGIFEVFTASLISKSMDLIVSGPATGPGVDAWVFSAMLAGMETKNAEQSNICERIGLRTYPSPPHETNGKPGSIAALL